MHAAQAIVLLVIASGAALPVSVSFLQGPPGHGSYGQTQRFELPFAAAVAAFRL